MDAERLRSFLLTLPHACETMQWGNNLVFWVGDKAVGGKMFALLNLDEDDRALLSYSAGPDAYDDLLEIDGLMPAPYMARIHWVAVERWDAFRAPEWEAQLRRAHQLTEAKLTKRTRAILDMPAREQKLLIAERRKLLADRAAARTRA